MKFRSTALALSLAVLACAALSGPTPASATTYSIKVDNGVIRVDNLTNHLMHVELFGPLGRTEEGSVLPGAAYYSHGCCYKPKVSYRIQVNTVPPSLAAAERSFEPKECAGGSITFGYMHIEIWTGVGKPQVELRIKNEATECLGK